MVVIGITGKKGAGKTYLASQIVATYGGIILNFAQPLKLLSYKYFGIYLTKDKQLILEKFGKLEENFKLNSHISKVIVENIIKNSNQLSHLISKINDYAELLPSLYKIIVNYYSSKEEKERDKYARIWLQMFGTDLVRNLIDKDYWVNELKEAINKIEKETNIVVIDDVRFINEFEFIKSFDKHITIAVKYEEDYSDTHQSEIEMETFIDKCDFTIERKSTLGNYIQQLRDIFEKIKKLLAKA